MVVHPGDGLKRVHPGLFGVNHRYPFDGFGMWDPSIPGVPRLFDRRFAAAGFTAMRFPGGKVANTYHWKRAIGPVSRRRLNVHGGTGEPLANTFGPDEFGRFVVDRGLQAMMLANFGTGTAREAADWVEYMNAPVGTNPNGGIAWARTRAANGHPAPYDVRHWEIGNELYAPKQGYWMGGASRAERNRKYVFGGSRTFTDQRVGKPWDHRGSAAISDGTADQAFQVRFPPVDPGERFRLEVGKAKWTRVDDLSGAPSDAPVYELDPVRGRITFGDGLHGGIPPSGETIRASYTSGPHDGFVDFYREMKSVDPDIEIGSCMRDAGFLELMGKKHPYDFVVAHLYSHSPPGGYRNAKRFHDGVMAIAGPRAEEVSDLRRAIRRHAGARAKAIDVVVSEFGMNFKGTKGPTKQYLRSMDQALYDTMELQRWMHLGVPLAGKHSLIDFKPSRAPRGATALGAPEQALIGPAPTYIASTTARAYRLVTPAAGDTIVRSEMHRNPSRRIYTGRSLNLLSGVAMRGPGGGLFVIVVNKARSRRVPATVAVRGRRIRSGIVRELVGPSFLSFNTAKHPNRVEIRTRRRWVASHRMRMKLPPHSVTTLKLRRRTHLSGGG